jgi:hypothetical protein
MKLLSILFESIDPNLIIQEFNKSLYEYKTRNKVGIWKRNEPTKLYTNNKEVFDRLLSDATMFKHIGTGAEGAAFSLGNMVLKLTGYPDKLDLAGNQLYSGEKKRGRYYPMVYDSGKLVGDDVYYVLLELFELVPEDFEAPLDSAIYTIFMDSAVPTITKKETMDEILRKDPDLMELAASCNLSKNWLDRLYSDIRTLAKKGYVDFHSGNIGIRRNGAEGYLVFFDL